MKVLVTGAAGMIGRYVTAGLIDAGHDVRGLDIASPPKWLQCTDWRNVDLTDAAGLRDAAEGMDTIIHLAAISNDADFMDKLLQPNVVGVHHMCQAAVDAKVKRLILTSSVQVAHCKDWQERFVSINDPMTPTNHYAVLKAFVEHMGFMYAKKFGLSVLSVRPGWLPQLPQYAESIGSRPETQQMYLSKRDAQRFFVAAVESENPPPGEHRSVFLLSKTVDESVGFDRQAARDLIGFEPQDMWPENLPSYSDETP